VITLSNTSAKLSFNFHSMDKTEQYCQHFKWCLTTTLTSLYKRLNWGYKRTKNEFLLC